MICSGCHFFGILYMCLSNPSTVKPVFSLIADILLSYWIIHSLTGISTDSEIQLARIMVCSAFPPIRQILLALTNIFCLKIPAQPNSGKRRSEPSETRGPREVPKETPRVVKRTTSTMETAAEKEEIARLARNTRRRARRKELKELARAKAAAKSGSKAGKSSKGKGEVSVQFDTSFRVSFGPYYCQVGQELSKGKTWGWCLVRSSVSGSSVPIKAQVKQIEQGKR